jgi:hypothetical protein
MEWVENQHVTAVSISLCSQLSSLSYCGQYMSRINVVLELLRTVYIKVYLYVHSYPS